MIRLPRRLPILPRQHRGRFLLAVLAALVAWVVYDSTLKERPGPETPPVGRVPTTPQTPGAPGPANIDAAPAPTDIFSVRTWEPAVAAAPGEPAAAPPPPEAPPLPFRYLGRIERPGQSPVFFLGDEADRVLTVRPGDPIGADYRVGKFRGGQLEFFYRPLKTQQFLAVGSA